MRGWPWIGIDLDIRMWTTSKSTVTLVHEQDEWCGSLRLDSSETEPIRTRLKCQLIVLSAGTAVEGGDYKRVIDEWRYPKRPRGTECYEFCNVMWIEWENGIASRKAIGTVHKQAWETISPEKIDIRLG